MAKRARPDVAIRPQIANAPGGLWVAGGICLVSIIRGTVPVIK